MEKYTVPELEMIEFDTEDVITTSLVRDNETDPV